MMVTRIKLPLEQEEYSALLKLSQAELRSPGDQAHYILRRELERIGLLQPAYHVAQKEEDKDDS